MSRADFDDYVAYTKLHFEEGLLRAGFTGHGEGWQGPIPRSVGDIDVIITLPSTFPFKPPRVVPTELDSVPWSWHRELDGALCLVAEDDHDDLWWTSVSAFMAHVASWFESSDRGWLDDRPDLDLDRYFEPSNDDSSIYLYGELDALTDSFVRFVPAPKLAIKPQLASRVASLRMSSVALDAVSRILARSARAWRSLAIHSL